MAIALMGACTTHARGGHPAIPNRDANSGPLVFQPLLDVQTRARLVVVDANGLANVDVDAGVIDYPHPGGPAIGARTRAPVRTGPGVTIVSDRTAWLLTPPFDGAALALGGAERVLPVPGDAGSVWLVDGTSLTRVALDGSGPVQRAILPAGATAAAALARDVVVTRQGRVGRFDPTTGSVVEIGRAEVVLVAGAQTIAWLDDTGRLHLAPASGGPARVATVTGAAFAGPAALSPDGTHLAVMVTVGGTRVALAVVEVATGAGRRVAGTTVPFDRPESDAAISWSASGWVFFSVTGSAIYAYDGFAARALRLPFPNATAFAAL
jgi:hypothetical protein